MLSKCIDRASKNDELDVWEFKEGFESHVREWIQRLREGFLSLRQIETLIAYRKETLANERDVEDIQYLPWPVLEVVVV